ncbi:hypothetical protein FKM82_006615 [Ascaphus truei]
MGEALRKCLAGRGAEDMQERCPAGRRWQQVTSHRLDSNAAGNKHERARRTQDKFPAPQSPNGTERREGGDVTGVAANSRDANVQLAGSHL